jgi:hypothetical protein
MRAQRTILAVLLASGALTLTGCKSIPDSSVYLGKWTVAAMGSSRMTTCPVVITKTDIPNLGERVMVKRDPPNPWGDVCDSYNGVYTITPEGALTREGTQPFQPTVRFVYDKDKNTVSVLTDEVGLQPMVRR